MPLQQFCPTLAVWICLILSPFSPSHPPPPTHTHTHTQAHTEELDFGSVLSIGHDSFGQSEWKLIYVALETLQEENVWYVLGGPECACVCACERWEGEGGWWKGARGVWGRLCTSIFILLYIYSHPVRGCYMITDYIFSSTLKSVIYKRNNRPYPPPQILILKLGVATFSMLPTKQEKLHSYITWWLILLIFVLNIAFLYSCHIDKMK